VYVPGWQGFDFADWARREIGLPVAVDNDGNVGAVAELVHGNHDTRDLIYVTVSTGIGAGVVSGGRVIRGATNDAGELGHIRIADDVRQCACGRTGCLERLCSGYWIEQDHGKSAAELFANDDFLAEYSVLFARGLASAVLLYNPAVVVLGGGVSRVGTRLTDSLTASLSTELVSWSHLTPRITTSRFDGDGVHLGAREIARDVL
jgi:glucokinase